MKYITVIVLLCYYLNNVTSLYCYWNTGCPYKYFSSKTPYNAMRGDIRDSVVKLTDCEPVSVWGLIRHGKTYPGADSGVNMKDGIDIKDHVVSSCANGNSSLCAQDVDNLRAWTFDKKIFDKADQLSDEGYQDLVGIGSRLKQAFPKLLAKLEKEHYTFRPASGKSMEDSAKGFIKGLQNNDLAIEKAKDGYDIMAPYTTCGKYLNDIKDPKIYAEATKYKESSEYLATKDRIKRRLGIALSDENISVLYNWCSYTWSGIDGKISPWCALFTTEDLKTLEYLDDLKYYYKNGYGTPTNGLFGKIPMADLLENFQQAKNGTGKKIVTYITYAPMMEMVYTALNLFKDEKPLTGAQRNAGRKWRNSKLSPFSANLFAVLNRCNKAGVSDYNVVFYLNEEPLIPICKEGVCSWQEFEDKLQPFLDANTDFC